MDDGGKDSGRLRGITVEIGMGVSESGVRGGQPNLWTVAEKQGVSAASHVPPRCAVVQTAVIRI